MHSTLDNGNAFVIPSGKSIAAGEYLVLVEDATAFKAAFHDVGDNKIIGNWDFTLSNKGERISLFDANKCLTDYVVYNRLVTL